MRTPFGWVTVAAACLLLVSTGELQADTPARAAAGTQPTMVRAMGYHRRGDSGIWIWRGNGNKMRTMVHELLHRATRLRPEGYREQIRQLTGDPSIDEGLTSYFTNTALARTGRGPRYPDPPAGASFGQLRQWSRGIRTEAQGVIRRAYGVEVETKKIAVLSDRCFGRCYQRDFGKPWESRPGQPGVYGNSKSRVQQLVELVGEGPVRRAYFDGQVAGLRQALRRAQWRSPGAVPAWVNLDGPAEPTLARRP